MEATIDTLISSSLCCRQMYKNNKERNFTRHYPIVNSRVGFRNECITKYNGVRLREFHHEPWEVKCWREIKKTKQKNRRLFETWFSYHCLFPPARHRLVLIKERSVIMILTTSLCCYSNLCTVNASDETIMQICAATRSSESWNIFPKRCDVPWLAVRWSHWHMRHISPKVFLGTLSS